MITNLEDQLSAAEQTEEWDTQKLRGHIMLMDSEKYQMDEAMAKRYEAIRKRLEHTLRTLQGLNRIS